jgi:predicted MFS family arabinose efflux permease
VAIIFGVNGLLFATWVSRLPAIRDLLHLTPGGLGLLLLCISAGAVSSLLASGFIVHRLGPARAVLIPAVVMTVSLAVAGSTPPIPVLAVVLVLMGAGTSVWDVAMNVEGAQVERLVGRAIMPRFHAAFSLGTVGGAGLGAGAAALGVPVAGHLPAVAVVGLVAVVWAVRRFVAPVPVPEVSASGRRRSSGVLRAWREPRTLAIGLLVLGMAFSEGTANDWLAVGLVDGYDADHSLAALGFGVFVTAMTAARMVGPSILERYGRVLAVRSGALLVGLGVVAVVVGPQVGEAAGRTAGFAMAAVGSLAWGLGAALGFPVGMSAAADDPERAAARVSVVSAIGYVAFLAGPPILGLLGDRVGVVRALLAAGGAVLLSLLAAGSLRPLPQAQGAASSPDDDSASADSTRVDSK